MSESGHDDVRPRGWLAAHLVRLREQGVVDLVRDDGEDARGAQAHAEPGRAPYALARPVCPGGTALGDAHGDEADLAPRPVVVPQGNGHLLRAGRGEVAGGRCGGAARPTWRAENTAMAWAVHPVLKTWVNTMDPV